MRSPSLAIQLQNIPNNFIERIYNLEVAVQQLQVAETPPIEEILDGKLRVIDLDLFPSAGVTVTDPTSTGYIGGFISGEGLTFGSDTWNFGGVNAGVIQVGINTTNGTLYAINANIAGILTVAAGSTAGGWVIDTSSIHDASSMVGLSSLVTGGDDIRFWAGNATPASAPFRVTESGLLVASNANITGAINASSGSITGPLTVSGTLSNAASPNARWELNATGFKQYDATNTQRSQLLNDGSGWLGSSSIFSWTTAGVVSMNGSAIVGNSLDADKVSFTAPTISGLTFTNNSPVGGSIAWSSFKLTYQGVTYTVAAGNTASKYVFWKKATSTTVLQTSAGIPANGADTFIVAMNMAGTAIQMNFSPFIYADYIFVGSLDALTVSTGALTVTGLLTMSSAAAALTIGTTPPSSATVGTGLWIDRTGVYSLSSSVQQATLSSAGLTAGSAMLKSDGLSLLADTIYTNVSSIKFIKSGGTVLSDFYVTDSPGSNTLNFILNSEAANTSTLNIKALTPTTKNSRIVIRAESNSIPAEIQLDSTDTGVQAISITGNTSVSGTLSVSSDLAINTNKFTVAASSGNTLIAGTLGITSSLSVSGGAFLVDTSGYITTHTGVTNINDDAVYSFAPPGDSGFVMVAVYTTVGNTSWGLYTYRTATGSHMIAMNAGANIDRTTGILTGTTGVDGRVTVSCHTDGKIYVENRLGAVKSFLIKTM